MTHEESEMSNEMRTAEQRGDDLCAQGYHYDVDGVCTACHMREDDPTRPSGDFPKVEADVPAAPSDAEPHAPTPLPQTAKHETNLLDLSAVWEFRPADMAICGPTRRFAEGRWIEDDGEYDLAFISGSGTPICLYIDLPYRRNIIGAWLTTDWRSKLLSHPHGNPWHYSLRDKATDWGGYWARDVHPNHLAGKAGMDVLCSEQSCANGRHVELTSPADRHVAEGLVRRRDSKEIYVPGPMECHLCGLLYSAESDITHA